MVAMMDGDQATNMALGASNMEAVSGVSDAFHSHDHSTNVTCGYVLTNMTQEIFGTVCHVCGRFTFQNLKGQNPGLCILNFV